MRSSTHQRCTLQILYKLIAVDFARVFTPAACHPNTNKPDTLRKWANLVRACCEASPAFTRHFVRSGCAQAAMMFLWPLMSFGAPRHIKDYLRLKHAWMVLPEDWVQTVCHLLAGVMETVLTSVEASLPDAELLKLCEVRSLTNTYASAHSLSAAAERKVPAALR